MKHINLYLYGEHEIAYKKLVEFGISIQKICRNAIIDMSKIIDRKIHIYEIDNDTEKSEEKE